MNCFKVLYYNGECFLIGKGWTAMFGYILTDTPELKVREQEYYRAVYCGLCRAQGKCTGQCSRMTLNYDIAFLALVRMAVTGVTPEFSRGRCVAHPFRKRYYIKRNEQLDFCARSAAILAFGKCMDDIEDEKGIKKARARLVLPFLSHMRKKAIKSDRDGKAAENAGDDIAKLDVAVREKLKELSELEKEKINSVDAYAEIFGEIMAGLASFGLNDGEARIMYNIGKHLGRWVYITDAADDAEEDLKKGRFNPFLLLYGNELMNDIQRAQISDALRLELDGAVPAFDLIEYNGRTDMEGIINNILYLGMPDSADRVLKISRTDGCESDKNEKKKRRAKKQRRQS